EVRGWDHVARVERMAKKPVTSKGAQLPTDPATLAKKFGTPTYLYPTPIAEQGEVDTLATALAEHIGSTFAEAEATAKGNPALTAGAAVSVDRVSAEFAGKWVISSARHVFDGVYRTHLRMSGRLERSLLGLTSLPSLNGNGGGRGALDAGGPIYGVMIGKVVDLNDPEKLGRVKVELPWMGPNYKTDWAWMVERGAGEDRGEWIPPEVGDTVVVAYEQGDPRFPFVIGNVYNGQAKPFQKDGPAVDGGQVKWRGFASKTGHRMVFRDESGKEHIEIKTGDDKFFIKLDQAGTTIEVNSNGKVVIKGAQDIEIESQANIKMKASQAVNIEAGTDLNLKGGVNANLEGSAQVNVKASGPASVKGNPVQLN
ncbi:MAG TPA: VgrG-related protein, partial [Actinomycetota bacterium]|nr:VgrG-related protein [Actinomycetota bacterium]